MSNLSEAFKPLRNVVKKEQYIKYIIRENPIPMQEITMKRGTCGTGKIDHYPWAYQSKSEYNTLYKKINK